MKHILYPKFPYFTRSDFSIPQLVTLYRERMQLLKLISTGGLIFIVSATTMIAAGGFLSALLPSLAHQVVMNMTNGVELHNVFYSIIYLSLALFCLQTLEIVRSYTGRIAAKRIDGAIRAQVRSTILSINSIEKLEKDEFRSMVEKASDQGLTWRVRSAGTAAIGQSN